MLRTTEYCADTAAVSRTLNLTASYLYVILLGLLFLDLPAIAQIDEHGSNTIESCIQSKVTAEQDPKACIGVLSQPCLDNDRNNSTAGMAACLDREAKAWDGLLNDYDKRLTRELDDKQRTALRDLQRAWIAYRDKACAFHHVFHQGTNAAPMQASCMNKETARHALLLRSFLNDAEGR